MADKAKPSRRTIPVKVLCQGVGKVWEAWVQSRAIKGDRWLRLSAKRILLSRARNPGSAVIGAIRLWRRGGPTRCERCGHEWRPRKVHSKGRCPACFNPMRYSRTHPLGIAALRAKGIERVTGHAHEETGGDNA